jgi:hypothetical protein
MFFGTALGNGPRSLVGRFFFDKAEHDGCMDAQNGKREKRLLFD